MLFGNWILLKDKGIVDLHSHVLPGVDDGAKDIHKSLMMLRVAASSGVQVVVATPHFIKGMYELYPDKRNQMVVELQKAADENGIKIQIKPGYECYLSPELLDENIKLSEFTINNNGKYILVEFPMQSIPAYSEDILFNLSLKGITPILAHPERNLTICRNPNVLLGFIEKGYIGLLSAGSILGYYGRQVKKTAKFLITHNLIHAVASDMHSANSADFIQAFPLVESLLGKKQAMDMFVNTPKKILEGELFQKEPPIKPKSRRLISFISLFKLKI